MRDDGGMRAQCGPEAAEQDVDPSRFQRRVTSFRSRHSAISVSQQRTWDRCWAALGTQARIDDQPAGPLDSVAWFGRTAPLVLEIGSGTGTSTLAMAQAEPDVDVVAVEVYRRGLAQLLSGIDRAHVTNIRLIQGDGIDVLAATGWHLLIGGLALAVFAMLVEGAPVIDWTPRFMLSLALLSLVGTAATTVAWFVEARRARLDALTAWLFLTPVVGILLAVWFLGERPAGWTAVGLTATLVAMWVALNPRGPSTKDRRLRSKVPDNGTYLEQAAP